MTSFHLAFTILLIFPLNRTLTCQVSCFLTTSEIPPPYQFIILLQTLFVWLVSHGAIMLIYIHSLSCRKLLLIGERLFVAFFSSIVGHTIRMHVTDIDINLVTLLSFAGFWTSCSYYQCGVRLLSLPECVWMHSVVNYLRICSLADELRSLLTEFASENHSQPSENYL